MDDKKTNDALLRRQNQMKITTQCTLYYFSKKPRAVFLLDALGAAFTTFSLSFVLRYCRDYFGMPAHMLTYLSVIGLISCAYSMSCFFLLKDDWTPYLRIIGISNFLYCTFTTTLLYNYYKCLTRSGLAYFLGEIIIILFLVYVELRVANKWRKRKLATL